MGEKAVTYQYFLLGDTVPVRVAFNAKGLHMGAEVPSREKRTLVQDATYLSRLAHSFEVEEITVEEFERHCERMYVQSRRKAYE